MDSLLAVLIYLFSVKTEVSQTTVYVNPQQAISLEFKTDKQIAFDVVRCESNFRPSARGSAGEIGVWQFMPSTFHANAKRYFPEENLDIYNFIHQTKVARVMWNNGNQAAWTCWRNLVSQNSIASNR